MRNQQALHRAQLNRDYSEHPDYWRDDEDEEAPFAEGAEEEDYYE